MDIKICPLVLSLKLIRINMLLNSPNILILLLAIKAVIVIILEK